MGRRQVWEQDAHLDRLRGEPSAADLVQRFDKSTLEGFGGVPDEVDTYFGGLEGAFDVGAQADRSGGAFADEHPRTLAGDSQSLVTQDA